MTFGSFSPQGISLKNPDHFILTLFVKFSHNINGKKAKSLIDRSFVFNAKSKICSNATHTVDSAEANFNKTCSAFLLFYPIEVVVM